MSRMPPKVKRANIEHLLLSTWHTAFETVKETLSASLADGSLITALQSVDPTLASSTIAGTDITYGEVISEALAEFGRFYPKWHTQEHTCSNQGDYPAYMLVSGAFFEPSLDACCTKYFHWDYDTCMLLGGSPSVAAATYEFYVDYDNDRCIQSCFLKDSSDTINCGGLAAKWQTTFATAAECCSTTLFWTNQQACVASSTKSAAATDPTLLGSSKWYVDWKQFKCVKDCDESLSQCGGLAKSWDELYDTSAQCCGERLSYIETEDCTPA